MAVSPAHRFGQIIGDVLETSMEPFLREFAQKHGLYLDKRGKRPARKGNKVSWTDLYGNKHDLDFVLERGGSDTRIGIPVAFIETAWRRYTKHSRNKAQEIQGAIQPLVTTHRNAAPFIGVILAGVFTKGALTQLESLGFSILYFPYEAVVNAFRHVGVDARFGEETPDAELARRVRVWERMPGKRRESVAEILVRNKIREVRRFLRALGLSITRRIESVGIVPLHGRVFKWSSIQEAISFIKGYDENNGSKSVIRYEVQIRYSNGDSVNGQFADKESAIRFLRSYQSPTLRPA